MTKPTFTIFYAWQSDSQQNRNRYFIQEAAVEAAAQLTAAADCPFDVRIDQDTQGVPGLCDIPATILVKIDKADAFLCDLTFVAKSEPDSESDEEFRPRHCSNPNVLFELGYAFKSMGPERVICVMNERGGPTENQIFDLAHRRFPIAYTLPHQTESRSKVKAQLTEQFVDAFRHLLPLGRRASPDSHQRTLKIRTNFENEVKQEKFFGLYRRVGAIAVGLIPSIGLRLSHADRRYKDIPPPGAAGWNHEIRGKSLVSLRGPLGERQTAVAEFREDGCMLGADTWILDPVHHPKSRAGLIVPSIATEMAIIKTLYHYCKTAIEFDAPRPWTVFVSLLEIKDYHFYAGEQAVSRRAYDGIDLITEPISIVDINSVSEPERVARVLKPALDSIWSEFGFEGSPNYTTEGKYSNGYV